MCLFYTLSAHHGSGLGAAAICAMWPCYVLNVSVCLCVGSVQRDGVTDQRHSTGERGERNHLMRHERPDDAEGHLVQL